MGPLAMRDLQVTGSGTDIMPSPCIALDGVITWNLTMGNIQIKADFATFYKEIVQDYSKHHEYRRLKQRWRKFSRSKGGKK